MNHVRTGPRERAHDASGTRRSELIKGSRRGMFHDAAQGSLSPWARPFPVQVRSRAMWRANFTRRMTPPSRLRGRLPPLPPRRRPALFMNDTADRSPLGNRLRCLKLYSIRSSVDKYRVTSKFLSDNCSLFLPPPPPPPSPFSPRKRKWQHVPEHD